MTKISSGLTFFNKKVFPALWFGFLAFFLVTATLAGIVEKAPVSVVIPVFMAVIGFFVMKKLVWNLADEVYDCGDFLLVRNRGEEDRVPLSNVMNVNASTYVNPPRITLKLVTPGRFGNEVAFSPIAGFRLNPFAKNKIAEDLIVRVDRARSKRTV
ncbi:MAG: hypothetical protein JWN13_1504 [Betaproteobacteria bacterium]|jgi:hypothetical protein|nr:hypothetical protein [Betaproteobacteria bacterium]